MLSRLDRYLLKSFLSAALFALFTFIVLFIVVNMLEQMDDFIDKGMTGAQIALYYLYFIPDITRLLIPVALLLASLFSIGRMAQSNELTAMKAHGMSLYRMMRPLLIAAAIISIGDVYFDAWVVPRANKMKFAFERQMLHRNVIAGLQDNLVFRDRPTVYVSIATFDDPHSMAYTVSVDVFDAAQPTRLVERYDAERMHWDSVNRYWVIEKGMHRVIHNMRDSAYAIANYPMPFIANTPEGLRKRQMRSDEMNFTELGEYLSREKLTGRNVALSEVEYYDKISFPFASFIVVLFGAALASERRRSGIAVQIGIACGVSFLYIALSRIVQTVGANTDIHPAIVAWFTNIVFLGAGVVNTVRVQT